MVWKSIVTTLNWNQINLRQRNGICTYLLEAVSIYKINLKKRMTHLKHVEYLQAEKRTEKTKKPFFGIGILCFLSNEGHFIAFIQFVPFKYHFFGEYNDAEWCVVPFRLEAFKWKYPFSAGIHTIGINETQTHFSA